MNSHYSKIMLLIVSLMTAHNAHSMEWIKSKINDVRSWWQPKKTMVLRQNQGYFQREEQALCNLFENPDNDTVTLDSLHTIFEAEKTARQTGEESWYADNTRKKEFWKYPTPEEGERRAQKTAQAWNKFVNRMTLNKFKKNPDFANKKFPIASILALKYAGEQGAGAGKTVQQYLPDRIAYLKKTYSHFSLPTTPDLPFPSTVGKFISTSKGKKAIEKRDARYKEQNINLMETTIIGNGESETASLYEIQRRYEESSSELAALRNKIETTIAFSKQALAPALEQIDRNAQRQDRTQNRRQAFKRKQQASTAHVQPASAATATNPLASPNPDKHKETPILPTDSDTSEYPSE